MGQLAPVSHKELVLKLRHLGFEGPYAGGKHPIMVRGQLRLVIPNVHAADIGIPLLTRILRQAGISRDEWESAK
jgi:predicted RNA binding protein YcfA (HicA-like mRNA interferase family)